MYTEPEKIKVTKMCVEQPQGAQLTAASELLQRGVHEVAAHDVLREAVVVSAFAPKRGLSA